jgi:hypothetical protein
LVAIVEMTKWDSSDFTRQQKKFADELNDEREYGHPCLIISSGYLVPDRSLIQTVEMHRAQIKTAFDFVIAAILSLSVLAVSVQSCQTDSYVRIYGYDGGLSYVQMQTRCRQGSYDYIYYLCRQTVGTDVGNYSVNVNCSTQTLRIEFSPPCYDGNTCDGKYCLQFGKTVDMFKNYECEMAPNDTAIVLHEPDYCYPEWVCLPPINLRHLSPDFTTPTTSAAARTTTPYPSSASSIIPDILEETAHAIHCVENMTVTAFKWMFEQFESVTEWALSYV